MSEVVQVEHLRRVFGRIVAVDDLTLRLRPGERVALWGPNGSGKTTTLRCVTGAVEPTTGTITVMGHAAGSKDARLRVGALMTSERSFYLRLTGRQNLLFYAKLRYPTRRHAEEAVDDLERELDLASITERRVDRCSTGMTQQLAFARALLGDPALLVLDEPTRSLDETAAARLWAAIDRRRNVAVLIATHRHEDLEHCTERIDFPA